MLKADFTKYRLDFKRPAGTSRGTYTTRDSWIIKLWDTDNPSCIAYGECAPLPGLSPELNSKYESKVKEVCEQIEDFFIWLDDGLINYPSIYFGLETALIDLHTGAKQQLFDTAFVQGKYSLHINGLIWMGDTDYMRQQIKEKIAQGFNCIKLKIGAHDIKEELAILTTLRQEFSKDVLEIRVDANGAFSPQEVMPILEALAKLDVHSIEQPIAAGQIRDMRYLCRKSPIAIALDEELIGVNTYEAKQALLKNIKPQYLILKPSLHGGFSGCEEWMELAEAKKMGWWITSALESNIGLNAIAQWASQFELKMPQGFGTGQLFSNNFDSPLSVKADRLHYAVDTAMDLSSL